MIKIIKLLFSFSLLFFILNFTVKAEESNSISEEPYISYSFDNNTNDSKNHSTLTLWSKEGDNNRNNQNITYGEDALGKYLRWESSESRGGGFYIDLDKELTSEYTIALKFSFDNIGSSWSKIIDYKNSESDNGFYFYGGGKLQFYPYTSYNGISQIQSEQVVDMIVVRQSNGKFKAYIVADGNKKLDLDVDTDDNSLFASINGKSRMGFFFDDTATSTEATNAGKVYKLQVWDKAIDVDKAIDSINKKEKPISENKTVEINSTLPNVESFITNKDTLPNGTTYTWKTQVDITSVGEKNAVIEVTYPDGTKEDVQAKVTVVDTIPPQVEDISNLSTDTEANQDITLPIGMDNSLKNPSIKEIIGLPDGLVFDKNTYKITGKINNPIQDKVIKVIYTDESGNETEKTFKITAISQADKYTPTTQDKTVEINSTLPNVESFITNKDTLPNGTTYTWKTQVDITSVGEKNAVIEVTYPDGTKEDVQAKVTVVDTIPPTALDINEIRIIENEIVDLQIQDGNDNSRQTPRKEVEIIGDNHGLRYDEFTGKIVGKATGEGEVNIKVKYIDGQGNTTEKNIKIVIKKVKQSILPQIINKPQESLKTKWTCEDEGKVWNEEK